MNFYNWVCPSRICVNYRSFGRSVVIPFRMPKLLNMKTDEIARRFGSLVTVSSRCVSSPRSDRRYTKTTSSLSNDHSRGLVLPILPNAVTIYNRRRFWTSASCDVTGV